jgi:phospholipid/cholesterol/gamma-HCH transport system substrate-binding protein
MDKDRKTKVAVGMMTIISVATFVSLLAVLGRWQVASEGLRINLRFRFLNNLSNGAPVRISGGLPVGFVENIYQKDLKTYVQISLQKDLLNKIPKRAETVFAIYTTGLMGGKYINITIPDAKPNEVFFQNGDEWVGIDPPSIDQMMMAFSSWFDGKNGGQVLAEIMKETETFLSNLNGIVNENRGDIRQTIKQARESFTSLSAQLDTLMQKLNILSKNFTDISNQNKQDIQIMLENMSKISRDLNLITQRVNSGRGSVGKLIQDEELYKNANEAAYHARELFRKLEENPSLFLNKGN